MINWKALGATCATLLAFGGGLLFIGFAAERWPETTMGILLGGGILWMGWSLYGMWTLKYPKS